MSYVQYMKRLEATLKMIERSELKSPMQLARKYDCSEKTARNMINSLRNIGHDIEYSRISCKYIIKK